MNKKTKRFIVAQEDTKVYNVFDMEYDFDNDGYLEWHNGEEGYHIDDFDVVAEFDDFNEAYDWVEQHTY